MKNLLSASVVFGCFMAHSGFAQGVPVIDATSLANQKQQFAQEIAQLVKEYEQAVQLYESINGMTDMDDIVSLLNDSEVREILGTDAQEVATAFDLDLNDLTGDLSSTAQKFEDFSTMADDDISAEDFYAQEVARIRNSTSRKGAVAERIVAVSDQRLEGLDKLRQQIGSASTQKEIDALNARIAVEQAMLQNDAVRIQGMTMLQEAQLEAEERRATEALLQVSEKDLSDLDTYFGD
jgi:type IV secretion system protein VirB5